MHCLKPFYIYTETEVCRQSDIRKLDCHPKGQCINTKEGPTCKCLAGYIGNGKICSGKNKMYSCIIAQLSFIF